MNQLNEAKPYLGLLKYNTSEETEWMIIDNGSTDPYEDFTQRYIQPERMQYIKNKQNIGLVKTLQQAYEACTTDVLVITHNDVSIYEKDWDQHVLKLFKDDPKLGGVGLFGAQGCGPIGERIQDVPWPNTAAGFSNMLEAEVHGFRLNQETKSAAIFDGLFMAFRMEMLHKAKGFDQRYVYHHLYDRDSALEVLRHGYKNVVANIPCHHLSGMTANRPEYQTWVDSKTGHTDYTGDKYTHDENTRLFKEKWKDALPLYVQDDFSFRTGHQDAWDYKGDAITKIK